MTRLPDRERILNAYSGGFAPRWIAERFGVSLATVRGAIQTARQAGDARAAYVEGATVMGRRRMTRQKIDAATQQGDPLRIDQFPDLPEVSDPILPFGGRIPQSVEDAP